MKFGRKSPKNAPCIKLSRHLTGVVPEHPVSADYLATLKNWQMLGNDRYGVCVSVTWANERRVVTASLSDKEVYPSYSQVVDLYKTQNPGFPSQDEGMDIQTCLEFLVKNGGPDGVKALGFARVDITDLEEVKAAIGIFGFIWTGVYVQSVNMTQFNAGKPWDYSVLSQVEGGHSVICGGYNKPRSGALAGDIDFITWAQETSFTDNFWKHLAEEAWVVIWPEHLGSKAFVEGMNLETFAADYKDLTGRDFPVDVTPVPVPEPTPDPDPLSSTFEVYATASGQIKLRNKVDVKKFNDGKFKITCTS